jgi:hypothetical protein
MGPSHSNTSKSTNENLESLFFIWLGANVNNSRENIDLQNRLRSIINYLKTFYDAIECENHIRSVPDGDEILFTVSEGLGKEIGGHIRKFR